MVSFEIFVKAMPPSLSELKVRPSFCFAFKIPDDVAASTAHIVKLSNLNHIAQVAMLNSDFFLTRNDYFFLKPNNVFKYFIKVVYS